MGRVWVAAGVAIVLIALCAVCLSIPLTTQTRETRLPSSARGIPTSTPLPAFQVLVEEVEVWPSGVVVTLTVRASGPQALLFDTPLLAGEFPTLESLDQARFDLLDLASGGQAQITLEFPRPASEPPWVLVFNPAHTPENTVAPRVEVEIK